MLDMPTLDFFVQLDNLFFKSENLPLYVCICVRINVCVYTCTVAAVCVISVICFNYHMLHYLEKNPCHLVSTDYLLENDVILYKETNRLGFLPGSA